MTFRLSMGRLLMVSSACLAIAGCGAASGDKSSGQAPSETSGTLLASITTMNGHKFEFRELESGSVSVDEIGLLTETPMLGKDTKGKSLVDVYRALQPNAEVPQALVAAVGRFEARRAQAPAAAHVAGPSAERATGPAARFYDAGEQAWFKDHFCGAPDAVDCQQGSGSVQSNWHLGDYFTAVAFVGSEGSLSTFDTSNWDGHETIGFVFTVSPGFWASHHEASPLSGGSWHRAFVGTSTGLVSLSIQEDNPSITVTQTALNQICYSGSSWMSDRDGDIRFYTSDGFRGDFFFPENPQKTGGTFSECQIMNCFQGRDMAVTVVAVGDQSGQTASTSFTMSGCRF